MAFWTSKRTLITGGTGFLGSHVVEALREKGCLEIMPVGSKDYDLTKEADTIRLLEDTRPHIVIHLAGLVGGILAMKGRPAEFFYRNLTMGTFMLHHASRLGVEKFIAAGAGCGYPEHAPLPLREESFWDGYPQKESAPYSLAKRLLHIQSEAYYEQHGFVSIITIPGNIYGPHDNFDLQAGHVVPALVRKFVEATEARAPKVVVIGTGKPSRDFVYAGDVASGILLAAEHYDRPQLVNLSSGVETSIRELVETLKNVTAFQGQIDWETSGPDGQARRLFDVSKARRDLRFEAGTSLREGLKHTVDWYRKNKEFARLKA